MKKTRKEQSDQDDSALLNSTRCKVSPRLIRCTRTIKRESELGLLLSIAVVIVHVKSDISLFAQSSDRSLHEKSQSLGEGAESRGGGSCHSSRS